MIPLIDLREQYHSIKKEIDESIFSILENSSFIGGKQIEIFENNFAEKINVPFCIGVANGTDSITLILKALKLKQGEKVLVPANSFIASSEAVTLAGGIPEFVDCDENYNISVIHLESILSKNPKSYRAIIIVHLFGNPADIDGIINIAKKYSLEIIEDVAQAHLAEYKNKKVGSFGIASSFSFYPGKNLGAYGDAGAVTTSNSDIAIQIRKLANHGRIEKYNHEIEGTNSRLDTIQAAILNVKLLYLENWTNKRIELAKRYINKLEGLDIVLPKILNSTIHVFHLFVVRVKNRDKIQKLLSEKGIQTGIHYPIALPFLNAYKYLNAQPKDFPNAFQYQSEILSLPIYPELSLENQDYIIDSLREVITHV